MLINSVLSFCQNIFKYVYNKSFILKKIDLFILFNIIFLLLFSTFSPSDTISYFSISIIILTFIKLLVKPLERIELSKPEVFLLIYFLVVLISLAGSSLFMLSLKGFFKTLIYLGFYLSFVLFLKNNKKYLKYILLTLAICVFSESIIAIKQNFLSVSEISGWQDLSRLNPEEIMTRVYGSIKPYNPNLFGGYILSALPSTLVLCFLPIINRHYKTALFGFVCFIFGCSSIIMSGCRGAYLGLFAEILLIAFFTYKFLKPIYKKVFLFISSVVSFLVFLYVMFTSSIKARIFSIFAMRNDTSNSFRFNVYNSCIEMFKDNWLLGIGIGNQNFREIYGLYMKTGFDALSAYNIYLEIAVESGIFALISFICFVFSSLINAVKYIMYKNNIKVIYLIISVVSISGILVHGFVDTVFFRPQIQFVFLIMLGIIRVITCPMGVYDRKRN